MSYQDFRNRHPDGSIIDTDGLPKGSPFQCVDVVKAYLKEEFDIPYGSFGNAKDYWLATNPKILERFDKMSTNIVKEGDITPLKPLTGNKDGHIGLATGNQDNNQFEMLEQNGSTGNGKGKGRDCIRTRWIPKSRLYGVLRAEPIMSVNNMIGGSQFNSNLIGKTLFLKAHVQTWKVYEVGSHPPRTAKAILKPAKFGGLSYTIEGIDVAPQTVIITTRDFGRVAIYIDNDAEIR